MAAVSEYKLLGQVLALCLFFLFPLSAKAQEIGLPRLNDVAPGFALRDLSGKVFTRENFTGKKLLLHFWSPSCFVCPEEMRILEKVQSKSSKFAVISIIALDTSERALTKAKQLDFDIPVLIDREGLIASAYSVDSLPTSFFLDENGRFIEIADQNKSGKKSTKFIGPRDWLSEDSISSLKAAGMLFD